MQLKEYQDRTLKVVRLYLETLADFRVKDAKVRAMDPDLGIDWPTKTWEKIKPGALYTPRRNALDEHLPTFCLKLPTGGGKTLMACKTIDLVNTHFRRSNRGLVLWVVPTSQIYNQTLAALQDRAHPYRQTLDMASGGRTMILERTKRFSKSDVQDNLCVLVLMLQAAARQSKESLRMYFDNSGYDSFFPESGAYAEHEALLNQIPNLNVFEKQEFGRREIKTSLGNTLRLLRPFIVVDEGQKARRKIPRETLEGLNPCLMLELSATPQDGANVLVDVKGRDLEKEEMIKLDLHVFNDTSVDWKKTLLNAAKQRDVLEERARANEAKTGKYIRPICLIQVERTGKEQRDGKFIHAEDVREYLVQRPGVTPDMVAIKSSEKDELKEVDDIGGLLSRQCNIRYIITKQALQEGWDCPFAYVLAVLTNPGSKTALIQLVGRILRQPDGRKTEDRLLNESYVYCFQRKGGELLKEIQTGFGSEGLGDLKGRVVDEYDRQSRHGEEEIFPRQSYRKSAEHLVLPAFMIRDGKEWRPVYYEADLLSRVPWSQVNIEALLKLKLPDEAASVGIHSRHGLETKIMDHDELEMAEQMVLDEEEPDCAFAAHHLLDVMPNPWRGNEIARRVFASLEKRGYSRRKVLDNFIFVLDEMHRQLMKERDRLAHIVFHNLLNDGTMRFMVVTDSWGPPEKLKISDKEMRANSDNGAPFQMNLFDPIPDSAFNDLERSVATFLDSQKLLFFWYRNRPKYDYYVQGWQPNRIFADFIVTTKADDQANDFNRVFVLETKGNHLAGVRDSEGKLTDTGYKRDVFTLCTSLSKEATWSDFVPFMHSREIKFEVIDEEGWKERLTGLLNSNS